MSYIAADTGFVATDPNQDPAQSPAVRRLAALSAEETLATYLELIEGAPDKADVAALALREQGRSGRLDASVVGPLTRALAAAPNSLCAGHLAKALATFGRGAERASGALITRMKAMVVTDDTEYWSFDGCVWALGYLGGPEVGPFLDFLAAERPSRVVRSQSIYRGVMPKAAREELFARAIKGARELLKKDDPGAWRTRKAAAPPGRPKPASQGTAKGWMARAL